MNILELLTKGHPQVSVEAWDASATSWGTVNNPEKLITKIAVPRWEISGWRLYSKKETVRGIQLKAGTRIVVRQAQQFWHDFAIGKGRFFCQKKTDAAALIIVSWAEGTNIGVRKEIKPSRKLTVLDIPSCEHVGADLIIEIAPLAGGDVFFGVHKLLDRSVLYSRCVGTGVEIGPGPKPQIRPSARTAVKYVEQATPDQWQKLYGMDSKVAVDESLWDHYVVGNADKIPANPESLDFIFSSHVVEHLANPLGHMKYWNTLLKPGGIVAAIIPDREGCKDFVFPASSLEELVNEYQQGGMEVQLCHYQRWAKHRAPAASAESILTSGRSIHAHFYTPQSMNYILSAMYKQIGFRKFRVISNPNHKDFFVLLTK
jgi:SAM-dependent methyltransferase